MDKYAHLISTLRTVFAQANIGVIVGEVKAVNGDVCTVDFGGLQISDVRLRVTKDGATDKLVVYPAVGSSVLCGSLTGDLKDLIVIQSEQPAKIVYQENGLQIEIDSEEGKIKIGNGVISLKELFEDLKTIIKGLKVFTPAGPSGNPLPDTIESLNQLQTKINKLLK